MTEQDLILFEKKGHIAVFTLNRPKAMNAVSAELSERFEALMEEFENDPNLWIGIVASSHPKTFCAGADLKSINAGKNISTRKGGFAGFVQFPRTKPMIAAVDGYALAGGCEIVLTCDMVVASKKSKFGVPEVKRSLVPAAGGMFRLPRKLPEHVANELLLTGDPLSAQRMYELGFVNVLCEDGKVLEEAIKLARRVEVNAPLAVFEARRVAMKTLGVSEEEAWDVTSESMPMLARTEDFWEGPKAFIEKRAPRWTGKKKSKL